MSDSTPVTLASLQAEVAAILASIADAEDALGSIAVALETVDANLALYVPVAVPPPPPPPPPPPVVVWNAADNIGVKVSGDTSNVATSIGGSGAGSLWGIRGTGTFTSGKLYAEFTITGTISNPLHVGLANKDWNPISYLGQDAGVAINAGGVGEIQFENIWRGQAGTGPVGDGAVISVCVDLTNGPEQGMVWFNSPQLPGYNGFSGTDPGQGQNAVLFDISGLIYFAAQGTEDGAVVTLNLTGPFVNPIPTGFAAAIS